MGIGESILALSGPVLQGCLAFLILQRSLHNQVPCFFLYTCYAVVCEVARFALRNHDAIYFKVYWVTEAIYAVLALLAIREIFRWVFKNFYRIRGFWLLLPAVTILALVIAAVRMRHVGIAETYPILGIIVSSEIAVNFLQVGTFGLFFILVRFFHVRWRQLAFGIALGFGISAAVTLAIFLLRSEFGTKFDPVVRITPPIAYIIAVAIWLATFLRGEPAQTAKSWDSALTPEQMIAELKRHTQAVKGILGR